MNRAESYVLMLSILAALQPGGKEELGDDSVRLIGRDTVWVSRAARARRVHVDKVFWRHKK